MHTDTKQLNNNCLNELRLHLRNAIKTLKMLPLQKNDRPNKAISSWNILDMTENINNSIRPKKNYFKATPKQITHMQFWLDRMLALDEEPRRIVMARATGISWRRLEEIDGRSHTTLRKVEKNALISMLQYLKEGREIIPKDFVA